MSIHYFTSLAISMIPIWVLLFMLYRMLKRKSVLFREPFHERPRPAGYSLQRRTEDIWLAMMEWLFYLCFTGIVPVLLSHLKVVNWVMTALSIPLIFYCVFKIKKFFRSYQNHNLGLKGEQLVGMTLDRLSTNDIKVFHDFPVEDKGKKPWNIDHIVVAPTGVYAVETKTRSKTHDIKGYEVIYENGLLHYPNGTDKHGLDQAVRQAEYLGKLLTSATGSHIPVQPILVLPGWMVIRKSKGIPVLNPKGIENHLKGKEILPARERQQVCHQLEKACSVS